MLDEEDPAALGLLRIGLVLVMTASLLNPETTFSSGLRASAKPLATTTHCKF